MKQLAIVICWMLMGLSAGQAQTAPAAPAHPASDAEASDPAASAQAEEQAFARRDAAERERIRQARSSAQAQFAAQEARCYQRFAVNDCLIDVRAHRRDVLGDLKRQEISLNDALRKRRAADQLLRSDARLQH